MPRVAVKKIRCLCCNKDYTESNFYKSGSYFFKTSGKIPYCKMCMEDIYNHLCDKYRAENNLNPEKKAIKRLCALFDVYYADSIYNKALEQTDKKNISIFSAYMRLAQLIQFHGKTYDNTLLNEEEEDFSVGLYNETVTKMNVDESVVDFFGAGFSEDDYRFLKKEYDDWVARHECKTKAQEEVFKRICFKQLEILKATRKGEDTKNLDATFQNLLETAKLQPKQNVGDTTADNQTFGTLINKWENTRPLPEIDEDLKDVDKIGLYIDTFFRGHLAKMMGLKNGLSNLYTKFMKKYTVEKPEYSDEENSEALFDAIFGGDMNDRE